ncbi:acyl carrier protein [Acidobacteriota bacterium]
MPEVTEEMKKEIKDIVYDFYAEECEVERASLNDDTNVIEDIEGDSLMFLELLEIFKKKYGLAVELKSIGKYVLKHPSDTLGKLITLTELIVEKGDAIGDMD